MKTIFLLAVSFLITPPAFAAIPDSSLDINPATFCDQGQCTEEMSNLVRDFVANPHPADFAQEPFLASGFCWHIQPRINPNTTHFALFLFENTATGPWSRGIYRYYGSPFTGIGMEEARRNLEVSAGPGAPVRIEEDQLYWIYKIVNANLSYWARTNPQTGEMYLISQWAYIGFKAPIVRSFCRMKQH